MQEPLPFSWNRCSETSHLWKYVVHQGWSKGWHVCTWCDRSVACECKGWTDGCKYAPRSKPIPEEEPKAVAPADEMLPEHIRYTPPTLFEGPIVPPYNVKRVQ